MELGVWVLQGVFRGEKPFRRFFQEREGRTIDIPTDRPYFLLVRSYGVRPHRRNERKTSDKYEIVSFLTEIGTGGRRTRGGDEEVGGNHQRTYRITNYFSAERLSGEERQ